MRFSIIDEQKANPFFYVRNQSIKLKFSICDKRCEVKMTWLKTKNQGTLSEGCYV